MAYPNYSYPPGLYARLVRDIVLLRPRDFHQDATLCIDRLQPPLHVSGHQNIPEQGRCVITINHYHRPGFGAQWLALGVSALVPVHVHWVMTGEFTDWRKKYLPSGPIGVMVSRILLKRIADIYGFTTMPPMPPRPKDLQARVASVRAVLEYVRSAKDVMLGLAPEGYDPPNGILMRPAPGLGRFGLLLSKAGLTFLPAGAYEADGVFHLNFGEMYRLSVSNSLSVAEKDQWAMEIMMKHIAHLLPIHLRGEFA